jgi:serine-type D-Ala-D-Ala carboxypeptidase (penicillin-binding protein 5/6)
MPRFVVLLLLAVLLLPTSAAALDHPPRLNAQAWLLVDYDSATVLVERNADKPLPPASLTKLMSAYLIFEHLHAGKMQLTDPVVISRNAAAMRGSRLRLRADNAATVEELIQAMLIRSANDATVALAEHVAGSEEQFIARMNERAHAWGLQRTRFLNPTGLDIKGHVSTARDMTRIAVALIRDFPDYYRWFSQRDFIYRDARYHNSNGLLWADDSVDGIKTGYTAHAGYCLIASARRDNMRLIAAVFGARSDNSRLDANKRLLDYGFRNYETRLVYAADKPATEVRVWMGDSTVLPLGTGENLYVTLPRGWHPRLRARLTVNEMMYAPVRQGQQLGSLALALDDNVFAEYPLVALREVPAGGFVQRTVDNIQLWLR